MSGWTSLPHVDQLSVLFLYRLFDFLPHASIQAYIVYQLQSFALDAPSAAISRQVGLMNGAFQAAQCVTAIPWGRIADAEWFGRKNVLLVSGLSSVLSCGGLAFATSFEQVLWWRVFGGMLNGSLGVVRTMLGEIFKDKSFQARAFVILPMSINIASLLGPLLGGYLARTSSRLAPRVGNEPEASLMGSYPYALPNLVSGFLLLVSTTITYLALKETHEDRKHIVDTGLDLGRRLVRFDANRLPTVRPQSPVASASLGYNPLDIEDTRNGGITNNLGMESRGPRTSTLRYQHRLPISRIWTSNVLCTMLAQGLLAFHLGAFTTAWPILLSTPRINSASQSQVQDKSFAAFIPRGGLNMSPKSAGLAMSLLGVIGIALQLTVYPRIISRLGTVRCYQYSAALFPLAYTLMPFLPLIQSEFLLWVSIVCVLSILVLGRTFALPATILLLNNCSPHPSVLGTIHGTGRAVSAACRSIGPIAGGYWYGLSLQGGPAGTPWVAITCFAVLGWLSSYWVREGSGHEVLLEGEDVQQ